MLSKKMFFSFIVIILAMYFFKLEISPQEYNDLYREIRQSKQLNNQDFIKNLNQVMQDHKITHLEKRKLMQLLAQS